MGHSGSLVLLLLDLMVTLRPDVILSSMTACPFSVLLDWIQLLANRKMRHFSLAFWFCIPFTKQIPSPYRYGKGNPSLCQLRYPFWSYLKSWPIFNLKKKQLIFNQQFKCLDFKKGHNYEWEWRFYHSSSVPNLFTLAAFLTLVNCSICHFSAYYHFHRGTKELKFKLLLWLVNCFIYF